MKNGVLFLIICCLSFSFLQAQEIRLNAYAAHVFGDKISAYESNTSYFNGKIKGGFRWGAGVELMVKKNAGLSITYYRQETDAPLTYYSGGEKSKTFNLTSNWILLAGRYYLVRGNFEAYSGGEVGAVIFHLENPETGNSASKTRFAAGLALGTNYFFSKSIGIKLQADLRTAIQSVGGSFYFGTGGTSASISSYSTFFQVGIGGGIVLRFSDNK